MGLSYEEAVCLSSIRRILLELEPLIPQAVQWFPGMFGQQGKPQPETFALAKHSASFWLTDDGVDATVIFCEFEEAAGGMEEDYSTSGDIGEAEIAEAGAYPPVVSEIRRILLELEPWLYHAAGFPNPFGGFSDTQQVYFVLAEHNAFPTIEDEDGDGGFVTLQFSAKDSKPDGIGFAL